MLAKLVADIPPGLYYEPKWDGFRAIVVRDGDDLEIHSRNTRPMARYFPDLVAEFMAQLPPRCIVDGEIVVMGADRLDFFALQQRIHPAKSRIDRMASETPASYIAFDLLALDDDLTNRPFEERRAALETLAPRPPLYLTPITRDERLARDWFEHFEGAGLDGVIAKRGEDPYQPGKRTMFKVKHQRTMDCVVTGYRAHKSHDDAIGSLLLGLYADDPPEWARSLGGLLPVGATASFPMAMRRELMVEFSALQTTDHPWNPAMEREGNRWNPGRDRPFVPVRPERVVEVQYDHMDGHFLRHPATFLRWRPDREPASCTFDQLETAPAYDVAAILA